MDKLSPIHEEWLKDNCPQVHKALQLGKYDTEDLKTCAQRLEQENNQLKKENECLETPKALDPDVKQAIRKEWKKEFSGSGNAAGMNGPRDPLPKAPEGGTGESSGSRNGGKRIDIVVNTHKHIDELKHLGMLRQLKQIKEVSDEFSF